jgi:ATP/ADP translocase
VLSAAASQLLLLLLLPCRSSPRIFNLVLLVMGYGTAHKLFGFVWKGQMKVSASSCCCSTYINVCPVMMLNKHCGVRVAACCGALLLVEQH